MSVKNVDVENKRNMPGELIFFKSFDTVVDGTVSYHTVNINLLGLPGISLATFKNWFNYHVDFEPLIYQNFSI